MCAGKFVRRVAVCACALLSMVVFSLSAPADTIPVTLAGANVVYEDIVESSHAGDPEPLFGTPSVVGDSLVFYPTGFYAQSGAAGGVDLTDGLLKFRMKAADGFGITSLQFSDFGGYSLAGIAGATGIVQVSTPALIEITKVDGVALPTSILVSPTRTYTNLLPSGPTSGQDSLANYPPFALVSQDWTTTLSFDIAGALAAKGISGMATELNYTMDNILSALTSQGAVASIDKKRVAVDPTVEPVPEPAALALAFAAGALGLVYTRRRRVS